jgi:multisubunit Na+/H+ antiporter MnhF subunit
MPSIGYWIKHFAAATAVIFLILLVVELIKGHNLQDGALSALVWSLVAGLIFIGSRYHQARKGIACSLCETFTPAEKGTSEN